ncbi:MAG: sulfatase-like hydrolase/transferase [Patescibacteria group bacterium]
MPRSVNKFALAAFLLLVAGAAIGFDAWVGRPSERPTVIYISIDSLRADHMGAYGYGKPTTPFLDSLLLRGAVFERVYAPGYLTFQTDAAVLSGLYPSKNNVTTWETPIRHDVELLPEILKLYGYSTGAFVSPSLWKYFGFNRGFDTYVLNSKMKNIAEARETILNWVAGHTGPRFVFWHIYDAHLPFVAAEKPFLTEEYNGPFASTTRRFNWVSQTLSSVPATGGAVPISDADRKYLAAAYDTGIRKVDDELRIFYAKLSSRVDFRNVIFVIASEHGEDLGEHGFVFHRDLYDVNTRVPLAIVYPHSVEPRRITTPVSLLDVMPTILSLAGIVPKVGIDGIDLTPLIEGREPEDRDIYIERQPFDEYALVDWPYKYIMRSPKKAITSGDEYDQLFFREIRKNDVTEADELYHLGNDPGEERSLIGVGVSEATSLRARLEEFRNRMSEARSAEPPSDRASDVLVPYFEP